MTKIFWCHMQTSKTTRKNNLGKVVTLLYAFLSFTLLLKLVDLTPALFMTLMFTSLGIGRHDPRLVCLSS